MRFDNEALKQLKIIAIIEEKEVNILLDNILSNFLNDIDRYNAFPPKYRRINKDATKNQTVYIDRNIYSRAKKMANQKNTSLKGLIEMSIREYIQKQYPSKIK